MLEQCIDLLNQQGDLALVQQLQWALKQAPLEVPADYKGPLRMYRLALSAADAQQLYQRITHAHTHGMTTAQTATRGLGGFVEVCREYALHQASQDHV